MNYYQVALVEEVDGVHTPLAEGTISTDQIVKHKLSHVIELTTKFSMPKHYRQINAKHLWLFMFSNGKELGRGKVHRFHHKSGVLTVVANMHKPEVFEL